MQLEELLDNLSLQVQDCFCIVEQIVEARTQVIIDAMNTRLEFFFAYQVTANQQMETNARLNEPLPIFPPLAPSPHCDEWGGIEDNAIFEFGGREEVYNEGLA